MMINRLVIDLPEQGLTFYFKLFPSVHLEAIKAPNWSTQQLHDLHDKFIEFFEKVP